MALKCINGMAAMQMMLTRMLAFDLVGIFST